MSHDSKLEYMRTFVWLLLLACASATADAQRLLTLDSCRAMALDNNKQMSIGRAKQEVAKSVRKSARTKYLPHVNAIGSYLFNSREISILNDGQKTALGSIGTTALSGAGSDLQNFSASMTADQKATIDNILVSFNTNTEQMMGDLGSQLSGATATMNAEGQKIVDAFRTDTRNIFAGSIVLTQPIFMGGSLIAMNKLTDLGEELEANTMETTRQQTLYNIDKAYWTVVSLRHKKKLVDSFLELVKKLDSDVNKMIREGVATRADGLNVSVKVNEAEMTVTQVDNGLSLARMLLCQLCGLPLDEQVTLADEKTEAIATVAAEQRADAGMAMENRPELKVLQNTIDMSKQATNILKAGNLPQVALVGGYSISNPNVYDGFQTKFGGAWNIGVLIRIPVWNWGDVAYKVRAAKGATTIAELEMAEAREKIELQVSQSAFKVNEASKKLVMATASTDRAEENLRCANLGFKEGVIQLSTVMEAQTAWLQAQSQKIDAEIDVKLSQVNMQKALGTLQQQ